MNLGDGLLPRHHGLAVDLGRGLERLAVVEQHGAGDDGVRAHDLLVMVRVRRAVGAVVAVDRLAAVTLVRVGCANVSLSLVLLR